VPIAEALRPYLAAAVAARKAGLALPWGDDAEDRAQEIVRALRAALPDLDAKIGWNAWRHTFCSLWAQTGKVSIDQIAAVSGHTPTVCRRHYAHLIPRERGAIGIDLI
jgi:integrase